VATAKTTKKSSKPRVQRAAVSQPATKSLFTTAALFALNKWFALLYAAAGLATGLFASSFQVPLQLSYLAKDELLSTPNDQAFGFASSEVGSVNLAWVLAAWLALFALVHILLATKLRAQYEREVVRGGNSFGWLTGGVLFGYGAVLVLLLLGGYDIALLAVAFLASVGAGVAGWLATRTGVQLKAGLALSTLLAALPWLAVALLVLGSLMYGSAALPLNLYITAATGLVLGGVLCAITWLSRARKGIFADRVTTEGIFTIVSFIFVLAIAGQIFAGVLW